MSQQPVANLTLKFIRAMPRRQHGLVSLIHLRICVSESR